MKTVKIGVVGLGRLGMEHVKNLSSRVPGAELAAVCDVNVQRVKQVRRELAIPQGYTDFAEMCENPELDAIVIVSPSVLHPQQIALALSKGKHVFSEKPLGTTVTQCIQAEKAVEAHPDCIFMLGFMRRYDTSYMQAKKIVDEGGIGKIIMIRSYTQECIKTIEGAIQFGPTSGGEFLDMCVHDIDIFRWFTGSEPKELWATGDCYEFQEFAQWNDADNASCLMKFRNGTMCFTFAGHAAPHGTNVETEIIGTRGILRIGSVGTDSLLEIMSQDGITRRCYPDFQRRWHEAYIEEMCEFVRCIQQNRKPEVSVYDGTACSKIAYCCKESFEKDRLLQYEG